VLEFAEREGIDVVQRPFRLEEAYGAAEAFSTSATSFVLPVVSIDGHAIGDGTPGPMTRRLRAAYIEMARAEST
jgi:D-alanine transaminase